MELLKTIQQNPLFWWVPVISVVLLAGVILISLWAVVRIPADYFQNERPHLVERLRMSSFVWGVVLVVKNIFALLFFAMGILMLVLPGQGVLTILVALLLLDFPGKKGLERWLVRRPAVLKTVNWCRNHWEKPELEL